MHGNKKVCAGLWRPPRKPDYYAAPGAWRSSTFTFSIKDNNNTSLKIANDDTPFNRCMGRCWFQPLADNHLHFPDTDRLVLRTGANSSSSVGEECVSIGIEWTKKRELIPKSSASNSKRSASTSAIRQVVGSAAAAAAAAAAAVPASSNAVPSGTAQLKAMSERLGSNVDFG